MKPPNSGRQPASGGRNAADQNQSSAGLVEFERKTTEVIAKDNEAEEHPDQEEKPPVEIPLSKKISQCLWGFPLALLILTAIICFVVDIVFIVAAINDADFDYIKEDI